MVFDVPAEYGGALSMLHEFYAEVLASHDDAIDWFFVLSTPKLDTSMNVTVLNYPWVKRSWLHRIYFDYFIAPQLIKQYSIDRIFSLQNVLIPRTTVPQVLYVHQPLPFVKVRFSFAENKLLWVYQNVISHLIFRSMRRAERVIVQTEWLRSEGAKKANVAKEKIHVVQPAINAEIATYYESTRSNSATFFYPASANVYKNHQVIVEACEVLKQQGVEDYRVVLTLTGAETDHIRRLSRKITEMGLPVKFVGTLTRPEVFNYYAKSVLLFPSYVETFGLPLLEAGLHGSPIIAADTPFGREILDKYPNAHFFGSFNAPGLAGIMKKLISGDTEYKFNKLGYSRNTEQTLLAHVLDK